MNHHKSHIRPSITALLTALTLPAAAMAFSQDSSLRDMLVQPQLCSQPESGSGLGTEPAPAPAFTQFRFAFFADQPPAAAPGEPATPPVPAAPSDDSAELAKKLSNPVASLISVPLQFNYDTGFGPKDASRYNLYVQPVIPFSLTDGWNLIVRTIMPVIYQESLATSIDSTFGIGDTTQSFFFSPKDHVPVP